VSASNWDICPQCKEQYGGILGDEECRTFREDYEIYDADTGTVKVTYQGYCQSCGLSISFKHERTFYGAAA